MNKIYFLPPNLRKGIHSMRVKASNFWLLKHKFLKLFTSIFTFENYMTSNKLIWLIFKYLIFEKIIIKEKSLTPEIINIILGFHLAFQSTFNYFDKLFVDKTFYNTTR